MKLLKLLFYTKCPHCKERGISIMDRIPSRWGYSKCSCKHCKSVFKINPFWLYISVAAAIIILVIVKKFIDLPIWIIVILICIICGLIDRFMPLEEDN